MPTSSSLFMSAIPISSLKLAGIKHPPPHPFSSHSFSIPFPHLHGVSRVNAILHSFTYSLKPLTQASISIQPTKPVSLFKLSPTCGILPKKCHVALSPAGGPPCDARHSLFHPGKNSVRPTFNLLRMSHIWNPVWPTFHLLRMSHIWNSSGRRSTFSGCLTSGILSADVPPFSLSLEHFL